VLFAAGWWADEIDLTNELPLLVSLLGVVIMFGSYFLYVFANLEDLTGGFQRFLGAVTLLVIVEITLHSLIAAQRADGHTDERDRAIQRAATPHEYLFFRSGAAQAVRDERWKLMVSAPEGQPRKEWLFDLTAEGEWRDLLAEQPDVAVRLRQALDGHNAEQQPSRWPWVSTTAYNVDRDLSQEDEPDDEFAYWSN
jgi:hypothetical protein